MDRGGVVGVIFDLENAFDAIQHSVLLYKLCTFNFSTHAINWFGFYLGNRSRFVRVRSHQLKPIGMPTGVPQGSILGSFLFTLYGNDLPIVCLNVNIQMYADELSKVAVRQKSQVS